MYTVLFPRRMYDMSLCHHQGATGSLARSSKLVYEPSRRKIFLDSDVLDGLDAIF